MNEEEIKESEEKVEENKKENPEIEALKTELENTTDRLKRMMAEFDNFKKRSAKEREQLYNSILSDIIASFLPVIDNIEKAINAPTEDENYKQGVELVAKQLSDLLISLGVEEIKSVGNKFDPELHEAVSMVQDENLGEKEIKEEFRKGYTLKGKVIRHAMVIVAN